VPLWLGAPTAGRLYCLDIRPCYTTILAVSTNSSRQQLLHILKHGTVELGGGTIREAAASNPGWQQSFFQLLVSKWSQWWCDPNDDVIKVDWRGNKTCSWKNNTRCVKSNFHIGANLGARETSSDSGPIKQKLKPCVDNVCVKRIFFCSRMEVEWRWIYYSSSYTVGLRFYNLMSNI
jgi:hypothetical protein